MRETRVLICLCLVVGLYGCGQLATKKSATVEESIGAAGGSATNGELTVELPAGAVSVGVTVLLSKVSVHPAGNVGPAFSISILDAHGSEVILSKPVHLELAVAGDALPDGAVHSDLRLASAEAGHWKVLAGSAADPLAGTVSGETSHLSVWTAVVVDGCESNEDCDDGLTCSGGVCSKAIGCDVWQYISASELAAAKECFDSHPDLHGKDELADLTLFPAASFAGYLDGPQYSVRTFVLASEQEDAYILELPCEGLTVTLRGAGVSEEASTIGKYKVKPTECREGEDCDCAKCVRAEVTWNGKEFSAMDGYLRITSPLPAGCLPFPYGLNELDLDLGESDGHRQWLRLKSDEEELLPEGDWKSAMESLAKPAATCPMGVDTSLIMWDNTCLNAGIVCGDSDEPAACHLSQGDDSLCGDWTVDGLYSVGLCDLGGITCEKPEVWDLHYAFDGINKDCEFCYGGDHISACIPLEMECGESVELPEQTASGSPEGGPHPQVECADWAVCPKELQPCYDSYPEGNECISGRMNVRFAHIPFGGDGECEDAQPGPDEPKECVLYHDSIANPTWCCNGYVANKTTWIHDSKHIYNCCVAGLESLYPDIDVADHIDPDGTFNYGLELKGDHEESSAFHLVCMEWFTADGTSWPDFILSASPITAQTYNIDHAVGDGAAKSLRVFCDPDQDPLWPEPQVLSTLGLGPGVSWVAPGGESCDDIQESSY